ncbi:UrcA family protein [Phenylobacterium sp.]|jgi:UrcA family protein|uniref:UrcA family protein n=1 Tax=Phenylobacterium sp. TaxID=1871053 RepID=UPI002E31F69C|nr:UrcA family protein [Phenylobacterium sp.]HEX4711881.1 UrcA family protein [Phenylobacterium sp.]
MTLNKLTARIASIATLALAALPAAALTTAAYAQPHHTSVQVADLNLATAAGRTAYQQRLDIAARRFCSNETTLNAQAACRAGVRAEVNAKLAANVQFASRG